MQPDEQQPYQTPPVEPEQANRPVVTLTPDPGQGDEAAYPAAQQVQEESPVQEGAAPAEPIRWQASEYVHREKDHLWFILFILATIGLTAVAAFLIKSWSFTVLVPIMAAALFTYTRRPPRTLDYTLSRHGLYINDQLFPFGDFKSFALMQGLEQHSIALIPTKRFKPAITINFPEHVGEPIVDMLAARLPMREIQPDVVDRIIKKLHL